MSHLVPRFLVFIHLRFPVTFDIPPVTFLYLGSPLFLILGFMPSVFDILCSESTRCISVRGPFREPPSNIKSRFYVFVFDPNGGITPFCRGRLLCPGCLKSVVIMSSLRRMWTLSLFVTSVHPPFSGGISNSGLLLCCISNYVCSLVSSLWFGKFVVSGSATSGHHHFRALIS